MTIINPIEFSLKGDKCQLDLTQNEQGITKVHFFDFKRMYESGSTFKLRFDLNGTKYALPINNDLTIEFKQDLTQYKFKTRAQIYEFYGTGATRKVNPGRVFTLNVKGSLELDGILPPSIDTWWDTKLAQIKDEIVEELEVPTVTKQSIETALGFSVAKASDVSAQSTQIVNLATKIADILEEALYGTSQTSNITSLRSMISAMSGGSSGSTTQTITVSQSGSALELSGFNTTPTITFE